MYARDAFAYMVNLLFELNWTGLQLNLRCVCVCVRARVSVYLNKMQTLFNHSAHTHSLSFVCAFPFSQFVLSGVFFSSVYACVLCVIFKVCIVYLYF